MRRERRRFDRYSCRLSVRVRDARDLRVHDIINVGPGGLFVETLYPLEIGTPVELEVRLGEDPVVLNIRGEVAWIRNLSGLGPSGMGIRFVEISEDIRQRLEKFIQDASLDPEG